MRGISRNATYWLLPAALFAASTCYPATIPISGHANLSAASGADFTITGPGLSAFASINDWPNPVSFCAKRQMCSVFGWIIPATPFAGSYFGGSFGSLNGVDVRWVEGNLTVSGFALPSTPDQLGQPGPAIVNGRILGINALNSAPVWIFDVSGTGTVTLRGTPSESEPQLVFIRGADFTRQQFVATSLHFGGCCF